MTAMPQAKEDFKAAVVWFRDTFRIGFSLVDQKFLHRFTPNLLLRAYYRKDCATAFLQF